MSRMLMLTASELTRDPRARRAALAARARGLEVVGVSGHVAGDRPLDIEGLEIVRVSGDRLSSRLRSAGLGGMKPSRPAVRELRGIWRLLRQATMSIKLVRAAGPRGSFDLIHANDFDTLPAAWLLSRRGGRLVYDSHELYFDQELDAPRVYKAIAGRVERALARHADAVLTSAEPYADVLQHELRLPERPMVLLNCPEKVVAEPPPTEDGPLLRVIYQAAMGAGRRLDDLLEAAKHAEGVELTVRVVGADPVVLDREIESRGLGGRVRRADPVPPTQLVEGLWGFDVGVIINRPLTRTDELVVPNKLFEYMMAGLAVVVPRLPGLEPIVEGEGIGVTFPPGDPEALGRALQALGRDRPRLRAMQRRSRALALDRYNSAVQMRTLERAWAL